MSAGAPGGGPGGGPVSADWSTVRRGRDVRAVLRSLFGAPPGLAPAVVHVAAVAERDDGSQAVLCPEAEAAPRSLLDRFVLLAARARAEAIVTTGRILRAEPGLTHDLALHPAAEALEDWRREVAGLAEPPRLLVLTASGDVDLEHPALAPPRRTVVFTSPAGAERLAPHVRGTWLSLHAEPVPDARRAVAWLQDELRLTRITVEAGPTAAAALYAEPPLVDELWLVRFRGAVAEGALGPAFVAPERLASALPHVSRSFTLEEAGGSWTAERRRSRA